MPNTREKLIELLTQVAVLGDYLDMRKVADHLIANGVTVRLPDKNGEYLVRWANKSVSGAEYESIYGSFGYWLDISWDDDADWFPYVDVTHWMPLPSTEGLE